MFDDQIRNRLLAAAEPDPAARPHHIADEPVRKPLPEKPGRTSSTTETGLPVEEQVEKEWDPNKNGGLPNFLRAAEA
jgi:hypothetical protein